MIPRVPAVLLDACVVIRLAQNGPSGVSKRALSVLDDPATRRYLSSLSLMEIAQKANRGRLTLDARTLDETLYDLNVQVMPFTHAHARKLLGLPLHHSDPVDRMMICTALVESLPIMTSDKEFGYYKGVRVIKL